MPWVDACAAAEVPDDRGWPVEVAGHRVAVFRDGGELRALDNVCRHLGCPLDDGHVERGRVTCPWHGWRYELSTGELVGLLGHHPGVGVWPVRVVGGRVEIDVPDRTG